MLLRNSNNDDSKLFVPSKYDLAEAEAAGITPAFPDASHCVTLEHNGKALAIGGHDGNGQCWFVTSGDVLGLTKSERKEFRGFIEKHRDTLLATHEVLWNHVWIGNTPHRYFLESIGAVFHDEYLDDSKQFQLFTIRR